jgi:predicted membrane protein
MVGQASAEFLILFGILSLIFSIIFVYNYGYQFYSEKMKIEEEYKDLCNKIKFEIQTALEIGPNYNRSFYLPSGTYTASINGYDVEINYSYGKVICYIPINLTAQLIQGKNTIIYNGSGLFIEN